MSTALRAHRPGRLERGRPVPLSALAQLIAGERLTLPPSCLAFALHSDRTAVVLTHEHDQIVLTPCADGLYNIPPGLLELD